jgi:hypothetical protein
MHHVLRFDADYTGKSRINFAFFQPNGAKSISTFIANSIATEAYNSQFATVCSIWKAWTLKPHQLTDLEPYHYRDFVLKRYSTKR